MRAAAARMLGERDFAALGADARGQTVRHLAEVRVIRRGDLVEIRVTANAFLRRMVRSMVALLMEVGRGRLAPEAVDRRPRGGRSRPPRACGAGAGTDPRARHLRISHRTEHERTRRVAGDGGARQSHQDMTGEQGT